MTYYGTAGPEFVRRLIGARITGETVRRRVAAFVEDALKDIGDHHGQTARVVERFGLVAVAGELAIELGIVPWTRGDPTTDATELFLGWLSERGSPAAYETHQIVAHARHFFAAHGDARFDSVDPPKRNPLTGEEIERKPVPNRAGWRKGESEDRRWYMPPEVFRREICGEHNHAEAVRVLMSIGALEKGGDGRSTQLVRLSGMETQRLYVVTPAILGEA
jgi:uncharacterized protein (DUF927 family)